MWIAHAYLWRLFSQEPPEPSCSQEVIMGSRSLCAKWCWQKAPSQNDELSVLSTVGSSYEDISSCPSQYPLMFVPPSYFGSICNPCTCDIPSQQRLCVWDFWYVCIELCMRAVLVWLLRWFASEPDVFAEILGFCWICFWFRSLFGVFSGFTNIL